MEMSPDRVCPATVSVALVAVSSRYGPAGSDTVSVAAPTGSESLIAAEVVLTATVNVPPSVIALEAASETVALSMPATPAAVTMTRPLTADRLTAPPPRVSDPLAMATLSTEAPLPSVVWRMVTSALRVWPRIERDAVVAVTSR